ncbi:MAG: septum formation initiator family protein [Chelatococcus sp.]|jgi:cell division protein FtsB|uniref:FtsB family cell division protein n=1 Tax=unclassified Chelatococcus TaxID=2638111 RepID=UPI001BCF1131|nr:MULTISPECIES: septum formation initiator family protein [unclassified Chelatococcus]CAH1672742.1 Cell division protein FtsB [Hyphomicrobiales bacterium]MBS7738628.1 septum formation initiator family protein [Chelatococcus sp. HY11]MBX3538744.1 septum formation initiator family protein [Chelatococcus sp.]MBX3543032.1 septum formation initiator family protein [Chelatococcus sp.]MCO5076842.1 septum formation initiator family protein [Chelatococcus sp.]
MVVRKRRRAVLIPLALYAISSAIVGYFVFHAHHGARGLEAKRELKREMFQLTEELTTLKAERASWEKRASMLRADTIDYDVLDGQVRQTLGFVHKNEVVILLNAETDGGAKSFASPVTRGSSPP